MLSKFIAWILAAITALMNNLGFWQQPEAVYVGDPGYAIQEDTVNYDQMRQWYNGSFVGENVCIVQAKAHAMETNTRGYVYILADQEMNPLAQLVFSDGDVIVAPSRGRITTQPSSSPDKIVVQNDEQGQYAYKMVINKPKKWFCCEDKNVSPNGSFQHRQDDHRITLNQGDTICVASSDTTIELYVGEANSTTLKSATLAEFLHSVDEELVKGNPDVNLNGEAEQVITNKAGKEDLRSEADIPDDKIFTGPSVWMLGSGDRWWYGKDGTAGVDYAANQYVIYENDVYYFDSAGYMITGWADDDHYYYPTDAYYSGKSSFKTGALCFDTMAPDPTENGYYVYLDRAGVIANSSEYQAMSSEGVTYSYNEGKGKYELSFQSGSNIESGGTGGSGNNSGGPNIDNQEGTTRTLTDEQWTAFTQNGESLDSGMNGWYQHGADWVYLEDGDALIPNAGNDYTVSGKAAYGLTINGSEYLFYEDSNILVLGNHSGETPVWALYESAARRYWFLVIGDRGLARNEWYQQPDGKWVYAGDDCQLLCSGNAGRSADGVYNIHSDNEDSRLTWYAFDADGYMRTEDVVTGTDVGVTKAYRLNGYKDGSRTQTDIEPGDETRW